MDYVHWWNHFRPNRSLDYESPVDYREDWKREQSEIEIIGPLPTCWSKLASHSVSEAKGKQTQ